MKNIEEINKEAVKKILANKKIPDFFGHFYFYCINLGFYN